METDSPTAWRSAPQYRRPAQLGAGIKIAQWAARREGAVRRAKVEQIDGAAAVVQHDRMVPRGGAVVEHNVAFGQPTRDGISATAERNGLDERGCAPNEQLRRAARQRAPIGRREIGNILCRRRWSGGGRRGL